MNNVSYFFVLIGASIITGSMLRWWIAPSMISNGRVEGARAALWASDQLLMGGGIIFAICVAIILLININSKNRENIQ